MPDRAPNTAPARGVHPISATFYAHAFLLFMVVAVTIAVIVINATEGQRLREEARLTVVDHATAAAARLESDFAAANQLVLLAASDMSQTGNKALIQRMLLGAAENASPDLVYGIGAYYEPNALAPGETYYAPYAFYPDPAQPPQLTMEWTTPDYNYQSMDWYTRTRSAGGDVVYMQPHADPVDQQIYISINKAMISPSGTLLGVLSLDVTPGAIANVLPKTIRPEAGTQQVFLVDANGRLVAHSDQAALLSYLSERGATPASVLDVPVEQLTGYFQDRVSSDFVSEEASIALLGWKVTVLADANTVYRYANNLRAALYGGAGVFWLLGLLGMALVSRQNRTIQRAEKEQQALNQQIIERRATADALQKANVLLEGKVRARTSELETAKNEAERANQVKSAFLASMSHELRTPLNAVINFAKFVADGDLGPVNEEQAETLHGVIGSAKHLLSLINDVLDMSKIESGTLNLFVEDGIDLKSIVEQASSTANILIADKPITLQTSVAEGLPPIRADRQRILQILLNIVSNACKFTEKGQITIRAEEQDGRVLMSVQDTGPGIALEDQALVFEAFKQTSTGLRYGGGTGLGMPISRSLAEAHGGRIWLDSVPGHGTTFFVSLPVQSEILTPMQPAPERVR